MIDKIKKTIINIMVTTSAAIMLLAVFAVIIDGKAIRINTHFEIFGACIVIHLGLIITRKFESSYAVLEYLLDISYIFAVLFTFGFLFDWFSTITIWYLIIMVVVIYTFGSFINIVRIRKDADELNKLLLKRKEKHINNAT